MAKSKVDGEIILLKVRASYLHCFKAKAFDGNSRSDNDDDDKEKGKGSGPKFSSKFIIDKKKQKKLIAQIEDKIEEILEANNDGKPLKPEKLCLRDGDDEDGVEFHGAMVLSASNSKRPQVRDRDKSPLVEADGKPYSGCVVNAIVRLWFQNNKFGKRVNASFEAIQFYEDGEAFGAPPVDVDAKFQDYDDEDDEDDDAPKSKKRRSRDEDEDEDEAPRKSKKRARDDDDEDEAPKKSKRRSRDEDDEDEEETPRKRRRSRDDDED